MALLMMWVNVIKEIQTSGTIPAKTLAHVPKLKDCESWEKAKFLGKISYSFTLTKIKVDGGLIELNGSVYYINAQQLQVLAKSYKWKTDKTIRVIEEKKDDE